MAALHKHNPDITSDEISADDYDKILDALRGSKSVDEVAKDMAEELSNRFVPQTRKRHTR